MEKFPAEILFIIFLLILDLHAHPHPQEDIYEYDNFGKFYYDRYDHRIYVYLYGNQNSREYDPCTDSNYNDIRCNRNKAGREIAYEPAKFVGIGSYRIYGRDANLLCHFPTRSDVISNVVWERVTDKYYDGKDLNRWFRGRMRVDTHGNMSTLVLRNFNFRDTGVYHCKATSKPYYSSNYGPTESIYMKVVFDPDRYK